MTPKQNIDNFGWTLLALREALPHSSGGELLGLLEAMGKAEVKLQRLHLQACNVGLTEAEEKREAAITEKLRAELAEVGLGLRVNGDPRGCAVRVVLPEGQRGNLWGVEGELGVTWAG